MKFAAILCLALFAAAHLPGSQATGLFQNVLSLRGSQSGIGSGMGGPREKLCEACTQAVEQLEIVLSDPALVNESITLLEAQVCSQLPGGQQSECNAAVEQYVPVVFAELESEISVDNICIKATKICPATPGAAAPGLEAPEDCFACMLVVKLLKKHLQNPKTQARMKTYLDERCTHLKNASMAEECTEGVDKFLTLLFANLDVILDPKKLCKEASLCAVNGAVAAA